MNSDIVRQYLVILQRETAKAVPDALNHAHESALRETGYRYAQDGVSFDEVAQAISDYRTTHRLC